MDIMGNAIANAITGMGTVFAILIIICVIIYAFNIIPAIEKAFKKEEVKEEKSAPVKVAPVNSQTEEVPVAVIAAAIAAYEEATNGYTGGFFVRSIKRRR